MGTANCLEVIGESESRSVVSHCLQPHGLYSPWNSPGQNTGVGIAFPFSRASSQPGIKPKFPALQADSLATELSGKPLMQFRNVVLIYKILTSML